VVGPALAHEAGGALKAVVGVLETGAEAAVDSAPAVVDVGGDSVGVDEGPDAVGLLGGRDAVDG
jgi:hypothetical protein